MRSAVAFISVLSVIGGLQAPTLAAEPILEKMDLFTAGEQGYIMFRIPGLLVTPKGTLLAYCEARAGGGDWTNEDILLRRSTDGGRTWDKARVLVKLPDPQPRNPLREELKAELGEGQIDARTYHNCVMIADCESGAVHVLFHLDYWRVFYMRSDDDGLTFSTPRELTAVVAGYRSKGYPWRVVGNGCGHGIQLATGTWNGRLLVPLWLSDSSQPRGHGHRPSHVGVLHSDDHGDTWQIGDWVAKNGEGIKSPSEACPVQLADGRVLFNMRHESPQRLRAVATSADGTTGWSPLRFDPALYDPICEASMIRVPQKVSDRRAVLFANPDPRGAAPGEDGKPDPPEPRARRNLTLKLSYDECASWPVRKVLESGIAGYCDLAAADEGALFCLFERGSTKRGDHYATAALTLARFNLEWLTDGHNAPKEP